jgi:hypothetical protein
MRSDGPKVGKEVPGVISYDESIDWVGLRALGDPCDLPVAIDEMMGAENHDIADEAYWRIEGSAFFQRALYQAAEPAALVVSSRICDGRSTIHGLRCGFDLLVEIAYGFPAQAEQMFGDNTIDERCTRIICDHLPCFYRIAESYQDERVPQGIVDLSVRLESDVAKRRKLLETVSSRSPCGDFLLSSVKDLRKSLSSKSYFLSAVSAHLASGAAGDENEANGG